MPEKKARRHAYQVKKHEKHYSERLELKKSVHPSKPASALS
jgi:hypothetical protein